METYVRVGSDPRERERRHCRAQFLCEKGEKFSLLSRGVDKRHTPFSANSVSFLTVAIFAWPLGINRNENEPPGVSVGFSSTMGYGMAYASLSYSLITLAN